MSLYDKDGNQTHTLTKVKSDSNGFYIDADTLVVKTVYDTNGNAIRTTDAEGNITEYAYDSSARVTSVTDKKVQEDGTLKDMVGSYQYDVPVGSDNANGLNNIITRFTNAKNIISETLLDGSGRILSNTDNPIIESSTGKTLVTQNHYDDEGNESVIFSVSGK